MLHPEKVDAVLKATTAKKSDAATRKPKASAKPATKSASRPADTSDPHGSPGKKDQIHTQGHEGSRIGEAGWRFHGLGKIPD